MIIIFDLCYILVTIFRMWLLSPRKTMCFEEDTFSTNRLTLFYSKISQYWEEFKIKHIFCIFERRENGKHKSFRDHRVKLGRNSWIMSSTSQDVEGIFWLNPKLNRNLQNIVRCKVTRKRQTKKTWGNWANSCKAHIGY